MCRGPWHQGQFTETSTDGNLSAVSVIGSIRVFEACAAAWVHAALVHASSVGAYSPGPADGRPVDEPWPTHGWPGAAYSREKACPERYLDGYQPSHPEMRVVRIRPAFLAAAAADGAVR